MQHALFMWNYSDSSAVSVSSVFSVSVRFLNANQYTPIINPNLRGVLCRECITPTVILVFADFTVFQLLGLLSPCGKHFENGLDHCAFAAIKDDMYLVLLLSTGTIEWE